MKRLKSRSRLAKLSSFTLVELLVVMGIIAILASVLAVSATSVINSAKRAKAATVASSIQAAVLNYYSEYNLYPIPSTATAGSDVYYSTNSSDTTSWKNISWALCGNINAYSPTTTVSPTVTNTHSIAFLSMKKSDVDANGIPLNPIAPSGSTTCFNIAMDGDYDGILGNAGTANGKIPDFTQNPAQNYASISAGVIVWANCNTSTTTNSAFWVHAP